MVRHLRAGLALGLHVLLWGLCGLLLQRLGLERPHKPWSLELFDAVAWAVVWTVGGTCYSAVRARTEEKGWRAGVGPAAIAGAAAGSVVALIGVIANVTLADGLTASAVLERAAAVILMGAPTGVIVLGAAHVVKAVFIPPIPSSER